MSKKLFIPLFSLVLAVCAVPVSAQVFRCAGGAGAGPEYINNAKEAATRNCQVMSGGNVTVVQSTPVSKAPVRVATSSGASSAPRPEGGAEQRARDSDSRSILEAELRKSETKLTELTKEYNNGQPEKQGIEGRNYQRYLDRVAEMKAGLTRTQSDIDGLKREIGRLPGEKAAQAAAAM